MIFSREKITKTWVIIYKFWNFYGGTSSWLTWVATDQTYRHISETTKIEVQIKITLEFSISLQ